MEKAASEDELVARNLLLDRLGSLGMHPVWGLGILAGVLALMYWLVGDLAAQRGVDFLEGVLFRTLTLLGISL